MEIYELAIPVEGGTLAAELVSAGPVGVVFAPGSALTDRDGNDQDVGFAPLAQLAYQLGELGISSLRLDRRGVGRSEGSLCGPQQAIEDFSAVLQWARQLPELGANPLVLGHAEGAGLAVTTPQAMRGLILIAPPASAIRDLLDYGGQASAILSEAAPEQHPQLLAQLQATYSERKPYFLFRPILQVKAPILLIHGSMDWVYPPSESQDIAAELTRLEKPVTLEILPGLDHWLLATQVWRSWQANLAPDWEIDPRVAQVIAQWIGDR